MSSQPPNPNSNDPPKTTLKGVEKETQPGVGTQSGSSPGLQSESRPQLGLYPRLQRLRLGASLEDKMRARAELGIPPDFPYIVPRTFSTISQVSQSNPNNTPQQQQNWVNPNPEFTPWRDRFEKGLPEPPSTPNEEVEIMEDTEPHNLLQDQAGYLGSKSPPPYPRQENYKPSKSKDK